MKRRLHGYERLGIVALVIVPCVFWFNAIEEQNRLRLHFASEAFDSCD